MVKNILFLPFGVINPDTHRRTGIRSVDHADMFFGPISGFPLDLSYPLAWHRLCKRDGIRSFIRMLLWSCAYRFAEVGIPLSQYAVTGESVTRQVSRGQTRSPCVLTQRLP